MKAVMALGFRCWVLEYGFVGTWRAASENLCKSVQSA